MLYKSISSFSVRNNLALKLWLINVACLSYSLLYLQILLLQLLSRRPSLNFVLILKCSITILPFYYNDKYLTEKNHWPSLSVLFLGHRHIIWLRWGSSSVSVRNCFLFCIVFYNQIIQWHPINFFFSFLFIWLYWRHICLENTIGNLETLKFLLKFAFLTQRLYHANFKIEENIRITIEINFDELKFMKK